MNVFFVDNLKGFKTITWFEKDATTSIGLLLLNCLVFTCEKFFTFLSALRNILKSDYPSVGSISQNFFTTLQLYTTAGH